MKSKAEAHESASLLFQRDGIPNVMIMDGAPEQTKGQFRQKCREAGVHVRETEPYSQWSNRAEGAVREIKRATKRAMMKENSPARLWDYCAELQVKIRSHTSHDSFLLDGEVPKR
jgi:transposase